MKKDMGIGILGALLALCFHMTATSTALASTALADAATGVTMARQIQGKSQAAVTARRRRPRPHAFYNGHRQNNQYFRGHTYSGNVTIARGHSQDNAGNQGDNRGNNQDNSLNTGNQIINSGKYSPYWQHNQYFFGSSYTRNYDRFEGYNQDNAGNQGINRGNNQDNSSNAGNQMIN